MGKEAIKMELEKRALPEVLRLADGTTVNTPELWGKRREEIREILQEECYGRMPRTGWETEWETVQEDKNAFGGKAVLRTVEVRIHTNSRYTSYPFQLVLPKNVQKPPVFLYLTFLPLSSDELMEEITDSGYAVARVSYQDIAPDQGDGYTNGPGTLFPGNAFDGWGKLAVWAWSASRIMDYLVDLEEIDGKRIAVAGHSRLGKAALLCGAVDDQWADPRSEFLSCAAVTPVYELLGEKGLVCDSLPETGDAFHEGSVGYHLRPGTHYLGREDWKLFMEYRRRHGV